MADKGVLLTGAGGYLGLEFAARLARSGKRLTCIVRDKDAFLKKLPESDRKRVRVIEQDLAMPFRLEGRYSLCINCAAVVESRDKKAYSVNIDMARNLIAALPRGCRLVHISSIITNIRRKGPYAKSKLETEEFIRRHAYDYIIFKPTYAYGIDRVNRLYSLLRLMKQMHACPLFYGGRFRIQPTNKEALVGRIISLCRSLPQGVYEIGGTDRLEFRELAKLLSEGSGIRCALVTVPGALLRVLSPFLSFDTEGFDEDRITGKKGILVQQDLKGDIRKLAKLLQ